ncbi:MAG: hypothetical protein K6A30_09695 [Lachnospiraceae bacterium]|nr:hypothetical protein [Lachnospiraceae bacterium]
MKVFKNYLTFLPASIRHLSLWIVPMILVILRLVAGYQILTQLLMPFLYVAAAVMLDYYGIGSLCTKEEASIDYIKSSPRAMEYFRNVFFVDILQKAFWIVVFTIVLAGGFSLINIATCMAGLLSMYAGSLMVRHVTEVTWAMISCVAAALIYLAMVFAIDIYLPVATPVIAIAAVITALFLMDFCLKRIRKNYLI